MLKFYKWLPIVDEELCTGCAACVEACGPESLKIVNNLAMLVCAETCGSEEHCIPVCPEAAIRMQWIPFRGDTNIGQWRCVESVDDDRRLVE